MGLNRRSFVGIMGGGLAAATTAGMVAKSANAQLVYHTSDWKIAEFKALLKPPATTKQVYDIRPIGGGQFLSSIKNSLNGLEFGFNIPPSEVKVVAAMHGPANMLNFDDSMWEKYRLGEFVKLDDPKTGKPALRNIYLRKTSGPSTDPSDRTSSFQDTSIEALQSRGVQFLSCHTATEEQARAMVAQYSLTTPAEEIVKDLQSHTVPGALIVPSMVASLALLQSQGRFTYIAI